MINARNTLSEDTYDAILDAVLSHFYRKYDREWVDTLGDAGNYLYHTVEKRIDEVVENLLSNDIVEKVSSAVWAMIEKEVDSDYDEYYLNAQEEDDEE